MTESCNGSDPAHVLLCRMFRWPELRSSAELKRINTLCTAGTSSSAVCCNPYHWSRLSPSGRHFLAADQEGSSSASALRRNTLSFYHKFPARRRRVGCDGVGGQFPLDGRRLLSGPACDLWRHLCVCPQNIFFFCGQSRPFSFLSFRVGLFIVWLPLSLG